MSSHQSESGMNIWIHKATDPPWAVFADGSEKEITDLTIADVRAQPTSRGPHGKAKPATSDDTHKPATPDDTPKADDDIDVEKFYHKYEDRWRENSVSKLGF